MGGGLRWVCSLWGGKGYIPPVPPQYVDSPILSSPEGAFRTSFDLQVNEIDLRRPPALLCGSAAASTSRPPACAYRFLWGDPAAPVSSGRKAGPNFAPSGSPFGAKLYTVVLIRAPQAAHYTSGLTMGGPPSWDPCSSGGSPCARARPRVLERLLLYVRKPLPGPYLYAWLWPWVCLPRWGGTYGRYWQGRVSRAAVARHGRRGSRVQARLTRCTQARATKNTVCFL